MLLLLLLLLLLAFFRLPLLLLLLPGMVVVVWCAGERSLVSGTGGPGHLSPCAMLCVLCCVCEEARGVVRHEEHHVYASKAKSTHLDES